LVWAVILVAPPKNPESLSVESPTARMILSGRVDRTYEAEDGDLMCKHVELRGAAGGEADVGRRERQ
jgi:hypothetical protein